MIYEFIFALFTFFISIGFGIYLLVNKKKSHLFFNCSENQILINEDKQGLKLNLIIYILSLAGILTISLLALFKFIDLINFVLYLILLVFLEFISVKSIKSYYFNYFVLNENHLTCYDLSKGKVEIELTSLKKLVISKNKIGFVDDNNLTRVLIIFNAINLKMLIEKLYLNFDLEVSPKVLSYYKIQSKEEKSNNEIEVNNDEQTSETIVNKVDDKFSQEQIDNYILIGKDFRENQNKYKKKDFISLILLELVLFIVFTLVVILTNNLILIMLYGINIYLLFKKLGVIKIKYNISEINDLDLGMKYASLNPKVKGHHLNKIKQIKSSSILLIVVLVIITIFYGYNSFTSKPITYDSTNTNISGQLKEINSENGIIITLDSLEDKYDEYKFYVPNILEKYFTKDNLLLEELNQNVELKVYLNEEGKAGTIIYIKVGETEYINQNTLNLYYQDYISKQKSIFYIALASTVIVSIGLIGYTLYLKNKIKDESIDLSK